MRRKPAGSSILVPCVRPRRRPSRAHASRALGGTVPALLRFAAQSKPHHATGSGFVGTSHCASMEHCISRPLRVLVPHRPILLCWLLLIRLFQERPRYGFPIRNRHNIWPFKSDNLKQPDKQSWLECAHDRNLRHRRRRQRSAGNVGSCSAVVTVPHDQGH